MIGFWLFNTILALVVAAIATSLALHLVGAFQLSRKYHGKRLQNEAQPKAKVPMSGIILLPVTLLSMLLTFGVDSFWNEATVKDILLGSGADVFFLSSALLIIYLVGLCKDLSRVRESVNLVAQGVCAALIVISGFRIATLNGFLQIGEIPSHASEVLTALVIIIVINDVSIICQRLSCGKGICSLVLLFYALTLFLYQDYLLSVLSAALLGCSLIGGNLNQKKPLFRLGHTGQMTMGLFLSVLAIRLCQCPVEGVLGANPTILGLIPVLILICLACYCLIDNRHKTSVNQSTD